jgi:hypothetical protein
VRQVLCASCFILADLACVAPVADENARCRAAHIVRCRREPPTLCTTHCGRPGRRWNEHTTRAFLLSLGFSLVAGDALKVLALTFVSASLLPGFLSPRARVLRLILRSLSKVIDALST